jgi:hypothetical protein
LHVEHVVIQAGKHFEKLRDFCTFDSATMLKQARVFILVFCSLSNIATAQSDPANVEHRKRYARAAVTAPTIEVLVVADESMVKFHGNVSIRQYVLTIMAKVGRMKHEGGNA